MRLDKAILAHAYNSTHRLYIIISCGTSLSVYKIKGFTMAFSHYSVCKKNAIHTTLISDLFEFLWMADAAARVWITIYGDNWIWFVKSLFYLCDVWRCIVVAKWIRKILAPSGVGGNHQTSTLKNCVFESHDFLGSCPFVRWSCVSFSVPHFLVHYK